jgi:hypothetical protein
MSLTLLHTSPVHVATFDALGARIAPGAVLRQIVREDLLARARAEGITPALNAEVVALIAAQGGPVLCTCTTLGEAAEAAGALRIDRPVMRAAAETGGRVMMAFCLASTEAPSRELLEAEMAQAGNSAGLEPLFLGEAWPLFEAGDGAGFARAIAGAVRGAMHPGIGVVVLAQASMAGVADLLGDLDVPVLASPELALRAGLGL